MSALWCWWNWIGETNENKKWKKKTTKKQNAIAEQKCCYSVSLKWVFHVCVNISMTCSMFSAQFDIWIHWISRGDVLCWNYTHVSISNVPMDLMQRFTHYYYYSLKLKWCSHCKNVQCTIGKLFEPDTMLNIDEWKIQRFFNGTTVEQVILST